MKKSLKYIAVLLSAMVLVIYLANFAVGASVLIEDAIYETAVEDTVSSLKENSVMMSYDLFTQENFVLKEGLTVIYGNNLDVSLIKNRISSNGQIRLPGDKDVNITESREDDESLETEITYLYMCIKDGNYIGHNSESVLFDNGISEINRQEILNSLMTEEKIDEAKEKFVVSQISDHPELLKNHPVAYSMVQPRAYEAPAVLVEYATVRPIKNYTPTNMSSSYPMVMYLSQSTFIAYLEDYDLEDEQVYTIEIANEVTPGSNELAYEGIAGVYNSTYTSAVVTCGAEAAFIADWSFDRYTEISPNIADSDINNQVIPVSIEGHTDFISLDQNVLLDIGISCNLNETGMSTVTILAEAGALNTYSMGTDQFRYVAMAKLHSGGEVLSTTAEVSVFYRFQNSNVKTKSYYQRELYYDSRENS